MESKDKLKTTEMDGGMAQGLRAPIALAEAPDLASSPHTGQCPSYGILSSRASSAVFWLPGAPAQMYFLYTHAGLYAYIKKIKYTSLKMCNKKKTLL